MRHSRIALIGSLLALTSIGISLAALEFACRSAWICPAQPKSEYLHENSCQMAETDLGQLLFPKCHLHWTKTLEGKSIYDFRFKTDSVGWRKTPENPPNAKLTALFFGCSITFGVGMHDHETLPSRLAQNLPNTRAYNFAMTGFGPQQMLQILDDSNYLSTEGKTEKAVGIYVFIPEHIDRAYGASHQSCLYPAKNPRYGIAADGSVEKQGRIADTCPIPFPITQQLLKSQLYVHLMWSGYKVWPPPESAYKLTLAIIQAAEKRFLERYPDGKFVVLFFASPLRQANAKLIELFESAKIAYLDYGDKIDWSNPETTIPGDGHPTPMVFSQLGKELARDIPPLLKTKK
jgi:hypothetical protein